MRKVILFVVALLFPALEAITVIANDGVLIFGATRNTGLEIAKILVALQRGDEVEIED